MKKRILTAVLCLPILFLVLFFYDTVFFNIACAVICAMAVYELLHNTKYVTHRELLIPALLMACYLPFSQTEPLSQFFRIAVMLFLALLLISMFVKHAVITFQEVTTTFFVALFVPYAFSSIVFIRNVLTSVALYGIILVFSCSWICDAGAYFVGRALGKHKLAPTISPKKTVEGLIGGILSSVVVNLIFTYAYMAVLSGKGIETQIQPVLLLVVITLATFLGVAGDLNASIIKRQCGIKDFGDLLPGHGGVMDRFDSILFIAPFLYSVFDVFPIITVIH